MSPALWIGVAGAVLTVAALAAPRRVPRPVRRAGLAAGVVLLLPAVLGLGIRQALIGYRPLAGGRVVGTIRFEQEGPEWFTASLAAPGVAPEVFRLHGNEWQVDARVLTWQGWARWLGLETLYRFERLSGRYTDVRDELERPRSVHALHDAGPRWWPEPLRRGSGLPGVEAYYGSAAYLPMADGAAYVIAVTASGIVARPGNPAAERAVSRWGSPGPGGE